MKRTKNMIYKPSIESRELLVYAENCGGLFEELIQPAIDNLAKKVERGIYETEKAVNAFYRVMCEASNLYNKDFGYSFSVADRFTAAIDITKEVEEEYLNI